MVEEPRECGAVSVYGEGQCAIPHCKLLSLYNLRILYVIICSNLRLGLRISMSYLLSISYIDPWFSGWVKKFTFSICFWNNFMSQTPSSVNGYQSDTKLHPLADFALLLYCGGSNPIFFTFPILFIYIFVTSLTYFYGISQIITFLHSFISQFMFKTNLRSSCPLSWAQVQWLRAAFPVIPVFSTTTDQWFTVIQYQPCTLFSIC